MFLFFSPFQHRAVYLLGRGRKHGVVPSMHKHDSPNHVRSKASSWHVHTSSSIPQPFPMKPQGSRHHCQTQGWHTGSFLSKMYKECHGEECRVWGTVSLWPGLATDVHLRQERCDMMQVLRGGGKPPGITQRMRAGDKSANNMVSNVTGLSCVPGRHVWRRGEKHHVWSGYG
jgi:hypothetical protein